MTVIQETEKALQIKPGNIYETIQPAQGERIIIIGGSETLAARCADAGATVLPVSSFSQLKEGKYDLAVAPLSVHAYADGAGWAVRAYESLTEGGRFIADFADEASLPSATDYPYAESLTGYWERLRAAGFSTVFMQQLTAYSPAEAIQSGWTELMLSRYPVAVYRFVAVKERA